MTDYGFNSRTLFARKEDMNDCFILLSFLEEAYPEQTFGYSTDGYIWLERDIEYEERIPLYDFVNRIYKNDLVFVMLNLASDLLPTIDELLEDDDSESEDEDESDDSEDLDEMMAMLESIRSRDHVDLDIEYGDSG